MGKLLITIGIVLVLIVSFKGMQPVDKPVEPVEVSDIPYKTHKMGIYKIYEFKFEEQTCILTHTGVTCLK